MKKMGMKRSESKQKAPLNEEINEVEAEEIFLGKPRP